MQVYDLDERVRVTVPQSTDPAHRYHGAVGRISGVRRNGLASATGDERAASLSRVTFNSATGEMRVHHAELTACSA